jgi:hypothetical protein
MREDDFPFDAFGLTVYMVPRSKTAKCAEAGNDL